MKFFVVLFVFFINLPGYAQPNADQNQNNLAPQKTKPVQKKKIAPKPKTVADTEQEKVPATGVTFMTGLLALGDQKVEVEIADNDVRRSQGLMNRRSLPDGKGMIFVFPSPQLLNFWMKDTLIPLAIGYFLEDGTLIDVQEMVPIPPGQKPVIYTSARPAKYALEVPAGWFQKHLIPLGAKMHLDEGRN